MPIRDAVVKALRTNLDLLTADDEKLLHEMRIKRRDRYSPTEQAIKRLVAEDRLNATDKEMDEGGRWREMQDPVSSQEAMIQSVSETTEDSKFYFTHTEVEPNIIQISMFEKKGTEEEEEKRRKWREKRQRKNPGRKAMYILEGLLAGMTILGTDEEHEILHNMLRARRRNAEEFFRRGMPDEVAMLVRAVHASPLTQPYHFTCRAIWHELIPDEVINGTAGIEYWDCPITYTAVGANGMTLKYSIDFSATWLKFTRNLEVTDKHGHVVQGQAATRHSGNPWDGCFKKLTCITREAAEQVADWRAKFRGYPVHSSHCDGCGLYHVTPQPLGTCEEGFKLAVEPKSFSLNRADGKPPSAPDHRPMTDESSPSSHA